MRLCGQYSSEQEGESNRDGEIWVGRTSPSKRKILKLLLLILSVGEPGKQTMQLPSQYIKSETTCAMMGYSWERAMSGLRW